MAKGKLSRAVQRLTSPGWSRKWNRCSDRTLTLGCWTKFGANAEGKLTFVILQGIVAFVRLFRCWLQPCLGLRMICNNSPRSAFASRAPTAIVRARVCDGFVALPLWLQGVQRSKRGRRSVRNCAACCVPCWACGLQAHCAAKLKTCAWTSRKGPCKAISFLGAEVAVPAPALAQLGSLPSSEQGQREQARSAAVTPRP